MSKSKPSRAAAGLVALLLCWGLVPAGTGAGGQTVVALMPSGGTYPLEADIPAELWIEDVEGLYGVDVEISFDPARLAVVETQVVPRYELFWPDVIVINTVDNDTGTIHYVAVQLNPRPPAEGSGVLFSFTFHALSAGVAVNSIPVSDLADINGMLIEHGVQGSTYTLGETIRLFMPVVLRAL